MRNRTGEAWSSAVWFAALLLGLLFILLILIMSWLLRTIAPNERSMSVAIVEAPSPLPLLPTIDPAATLLASLLDVREDAKRLAAELAVLSDDFKHKSERCKLPALPADRWSSKDLSVLQGCWYLGREVPTVRFDLGTFSQEENCTTKVGRICFDADGHGIREQTVMPRDIARLKRDHRGYPVPYVVIQDPPSLAVMVAISTKSIITLNQRLAVWYGQVGQKLVKMH